MVQIYIDGQLIDLYEDESISITSTIQNVKDISKLFTDFSQSFNVPATTNNNKVFKHWYKYGVVNGFDARTRIEASIDVDYKNFKQGVVRLNNAKINRGKPDSYNITFYSNVVHLIDLFGDDELIDLDLSAYEFDFVDNTVKSLIEVGNPNYFVPLISTKRNWTFNSNITNNIGNNWSGAGLERDELRPSLRAKVIISAIEAKYGVSFSDDFFESNSFGQLFIFANRTIGDGHFYSDLKELTVFDGIGIPNWNKQVSVNNTIQRVTVSIHNNSQSSLVDNDFYIEIEDDKGTITYPYSTNNFGSVFYTLLYSGTNETRTLTVRVKCNNPFDGDIRTTVKEYNSSGNLLAIKSYESLAVLDERFRFSSNNGNIGQLPKLTVKDFFISLIKMYNLILEPISTTSYKVITLNDWYNQGVQKNLTKYIDEQQLTIERPNLPSEIGFNYDVTEEVVTNKGYIDNNITTYGNLNQKYIFDGNLLSVESKFDNLLMQRISDDLGNTISKYLVGNLVDENLEPIKTNPIMMYKGAGITNFDDPVRLAFKQFGSQVIVSRYNVYSQELVPNTATGVITDSLNFGSEISTLNIEETQQSLYNNYWRNYIEDILSEKRRLHKFSGYIPNHIINNVNLNDSIVIGINKYIVNQIKTNITTDKVELELLNDI